MEGIKCDLRLNQSMMLMIDDDGNSGYFIPADGEKQISMRCTLIYASARVLQAQAARQGAAPIGWF